MPRPDRRWLLAATIAFVAILAATLCFDAAPLARPTGRPAHLSLFISSDDPRVVVARSIVRPIVRVLARIAASEAEAQTRMQFKPVPAESADAFDRPSSSSGGHPRHTVPPPVAPVTPPAATRPETSDDNEPAEPPVPGTTGNIVQIGSDIHVEKGQVVDGDVLAIGGDIRVDGHVRGNVSATRGDVTLGSSARVDRDVLCIGGTLHEEPGAYVGGQRVTGLEGHERIRSHVDRDLDIEDSAIRHRGAAVVRGILYLLMWLLIAWVLTRFAPTRTGTALRSLQDEAGLALGYGFLIVLLLVPSVVALAFVVVLLCITIVGIPVALGALLAYAALLIVLAGWGAVVGYAALGRRFARGSGQNAPALTASAIAGVLIIHALLLGGHILHLIPFMGGFGTLLRVLGIVADSVLVLLGMGALVRSKFGQGPQGLWWPPQHLFRSIDPNATGTTGGWWAPGGAPAPAPAPMTPPPIAPAPAPMAPPPVAAMPEAGPLSASTPPEPGAPPPPPPPPPPPAPPAPIGP